MSDRSTTLLARLATSFVGGALAAVLVLGAAFALRTPEPASSSGVAPRASFAALGSAPEDFRAAATRSMAGVVHISSLAERSPSLWDLYYGRRAQVVEGTGSGVIYRADGYVVTNHHVVRGANAVYVSLSDNRRFRAQVVGSYPEADLAVLKVDAAGLPALRFADSDETEVGDWVLAVGNPYDLSSTVTAGIVSARGRDIGIINARNAIESFIQTDAAINPGNSGGALVNTRGDVVGINTAIYSRSGGYSGYGFAIPANLAARIADDIIATGSFRQVVLGIDATELTEDYARELGVAVTQGIVVEEVESGGLAAGAGLRPGDIVVEVDARPLRSIAEFREAISSQPRGGRLPLTVLRRGQLVPLTLSL